MDTVPAKQPSLKESHASSAGIGVFVTALEMGRETQWNENTAQLAFSLLPHLATVSNSL